MPFDPDTAWGRKHRHLVGGTVNGVRIRGAVTATPEGYALTLGPAWLRDCHLAPGDSVAVEITPEGPQRADLADDVAAALNASPQAGAFFDSLAQFYRRAYLRWIDATKRSPETRAQRIAEKSDNDRQRLRLAYNYAWTVIFWFDDYNQLNKIYDAVAALALKSNQSEEVERAANLWMVFRPRLTEAY